MSSPILGEPNSLLASSEKPKKKLPKVAYYVGGSAMALTLGLTALVVPFIRQAAKSMNRPEFLSNHHLPALTSRRFPTSSFTAPLSKIELSLPNSPHTDPTAESVMCTEEVPSEQLIKSRLFNSREEQSLFGASLMPLSSSPTAQSQQEHGEQANNFDGNLSGIKAFMYATALVLGCTGLGVWGVGKAIGATDASEFAVKMRQHLALAMPGLIETINKPDRSDDSDSNTLELWIQQLKSEDEGN
ncbi:hypothetical protein L204_100028 [Cryptococcus depauperatus]|nr:hypothetical protein L204_02491 [Cryptococcus depauperatus CBS 7855]